MAKLRMLARTKAGMFRNGMYAAIVGRTRLAPGSPRDQRAAEQGMIHQVRSVRQQLNGGLRAE